MKVYLAAQFKEQETMRLWRRVLQDHGHIVTSRWLDHTETNDPIEANQKALIDLQDIDNSEYVISHTLNRGDLFTGGGRHIEFGYALAKGIELINVGGIENVFHQLFNVTTVDTIQDACNLLVPIPDDE